MSVGDGIAPAAGTRTSPALDRLGLLIAALGFYGLLFAPLMTLRANRIVPGEGRMAWEALPALSAGLFCAVAVAALVAASVRARPSFRLVAGLAGLGALAIFVGIAGDHLTPEGDRLARVSPASGFWMLLLAFALLLTDSLSRMTIRPAGRVALLFGGALVFLAVPASGLWDDLSVMKEYQARADSFRAEGVRHLALAFGSMAAAVAAGIPLGVACHRAPRARAAVLNLLNVIQTIPSIALFGLLIAPLGWLAANVPAAAALGIRGIGVAPAVVALFLYSLLPVVANTVAGLASVPAAVREAARGMGMTGGQRLMRVELPLALPVMLTAIRIVLVQNIGLATVAALIGGGGFGVFVFQGIGQMAMDLVLLGALPTVLLAFASAIILDALVERLSVPARNGDAA
ncbi:MAG TPA: ABC transporter permease [Aquamicrobium sp.]|nr:ABC transporter permease [Aquamicrobium sp.]